MWAAITAVFPLIGNIFPPGLTGSEEFQLLKTTLAASKMNSGITDAELQELADLAKAEILISAVTQQATPTTIDYLTQLTSSIAPTLPFPYNTIAVLGSNLSNLRNQPNRLQQVNLMELTLSARKKKNT